VTAPVRVTTLSEALDAAAQGNKSGVRFLLSHGAAAVPAVVAHYAHTRRAAGRAAELFFLIRFARSDDAVFSLGLSALNDRVRDVQERALALIAHSLREDALPVLERFRQSPTLTKAAISAIRTRHIKPFTDVAGHLWYFDRREMGRAPWPSFADDFTSGCGELLNALGFRVERGFAEGVSFVRGASRFVATWDNYDVLVQLSLNGVDLESLLRAAGNPAVAEIRALRQGGSTALRQLGEILKTCLPFVLEQEAALRAKVAELNATLAGDQSKVPALLTLLDAKSDLYSAAADSLGKLGQKAGSVAAAQLAEGLGHENPDVRRSSASALESVATISTVPDLIVGLASADPQVRGGVARALSQLGPKGEAAAHAIVAALSKSQPSWLRIQLAGALLDVTRQTAGQTAEPVLIKALTGRSVLDRAQAARVLAKVGAPSQQALRALQVALLDREPLVRFDAAATLAKVAPKTPRLRSTLKALTQAPYRRPIQEQAEMLLLRLDDARREKDARRRAKV
jgi:HEAT repeat protein